MLYATTRCDQETFPAQRALLESRGADGGLFVPHPAPKFDSGQLDDLLNMPFHACLTELMNLLFDKKITGWDVEFAIGRNPVALKNLGRRVAVAELWRNPGWEFDRLVRNLLNLLCDEAREQIGEWTRVAAGAAALFGVFGQLRKSGIDQMVDVCAVTGDLSMPMSAWYARAWGLPIGNVICCCNENNGLWDLICHGQMRTDALAVATSTPDADISLPVGLERLIFHCGGVSEVERYLDLGRQGRMYCPEEPVLNQLRQGLFVSVVSSQRVEAMISNIFSTNSYLLSPYTAMCYAGLLDYRARTGETRPCLILAEKSPSLDVETVERATGMTRQEIVKHI